MARLWLMIATHARDDGKVRRLLSVIIACLLTVLA